MGIELTASDPSQYERPFWEPIGRFVFQFGYLEKDVDWSVESLLETSHSRAAAVTHKIKNLSARAELIHTLTNLRTRDDALKQRMTILQAELIDLNSFRNNLVHGAWGAYFVEESKWQKVRIETQVRRKTKVFHFTVSDIEERTLRTTKASLALVNLVQKILHAQPASDAQPP
jgi:hypothetical protein